MTDEELVAIVFGDDAYVETIDGKQVVWSRFSGDWRENGATVMLTEALQTFEANADKPMTPDPLAVFLGEYVRKLRGPHD